MPAAVQSIMGHGEILGKLRAHDGSEDCVLQNSLTTLEASVPALHPAKQGGICL